jgi:hypothetical protein
MINQIGAPAKPSQEKRVEALSLLEDVIAMSDRIAPVEYSALTQVEAATLLWPTDKERSVAMLKKSFGAMRELLEQQSKPKSELPSPGTRAERVWFSIIRKTTALNPDLAADILLSSDSSSVKVKLEWTAEARAVMAVASDQIQRDPAKAARLAESGLSLGLVDWSSFLLALYKKDDSLAERLSIAVLDRFRDSAVAPLVLLNFGRYYLAPDRSPGTREHFLQVLAARLRQDIGPGAAIRDLEDDLRVAQATLRSPAAFSPRWQQEFAGIADAVEAKFAERSVPLPGQPRTIVVDASSVMPATSGDTQDVSDALPKVAAITNSQARDREYQRLALRAAGKANLLLAEDAMSKIKDESYRQASTVFVYGPFVRKAIVESDWQQAQKFALKIEEPLGRTLALDRVAKGMSQAGEKREHILDCIALALFRLERDPASEAVAKALLIFARSIESVDTERALEAVRSSIWVLNKLKERGEPLGESLVGEEVSTWVSLPNSFTNADQALDLPELILTTFKELQKRKPDEALPMALGLYDRAMRSLAQLAISREVIEEADAAVAAPRRTEK